MQNITTIELLAKQLLEKYNLQDWKFTWDLRSFNRFGVCKYKPKEISLSKKVALALPIEVSIDTLLHEIAHALTPGQSHNDIWKAKCVELGCKPQQYATENNDVIQPYKGTCPTCGDIMYSGRKTGIICTPCMNKDYHATGNSNWQNHKYVWVKNY